MGRRETESVKRQDIRQRGGDERIASGMRRGSVGGMQGG